MTYILDRLAERSTWQGLAAVAAVIGVNLSPDLAGAIVAFGVAAAGLIHEVFPETGKIDR